MREDQKVSSTTQDESVQAPCVASVPCTMFGSAQPADSDTQAADTSEYNRLPPLHEPRSLMNELSPDPPTPYKPIVRRPAKPSVLPSLFKPRSQRSPLLPFRVAAMQDTSEGVNAGDEMRPAMRAASTEPDAVRREGLGQHSPAEMTSAVLQPPLPPLVASAALSMAPSEAAGGETPTAEDAVVLLCQQQQQRLWMEESAGRDDLHAQERNAFTKLEVALGNEQMLILAQEGGRNAQQEVAEVQEEEAARAKERAAMLAAHAELASRTVMEAVVVQKTAAKREELLQQHRKGYDRISQEEHDALLEVFKWHKAHQPLGPGCFIRGPEEDPRLLPPVRERGEGDNRGSTPHTRLSPFKPSTERTAFARPIVKQRSIAGDCSQGKTTATTVMPTTMRSEEEAVCRVLVFDEAEVGELRVSREEVAREVPFAEEGKARLRQEKARRHHVLQKDSVREEFLLAVTATCESILAMESERWTALMEDAFDDLCAAEERTRLREAYEAEERARRQEFEQARVDIKCCILAEDFIEDDEAQAAAEGEWKPDGRLTDGFVSADELSASVGVTPMPATKALSSATSMCDGEVTVLDFFRTPAQRGSVSQHLGEVVQHHQELERRQSDARSQKR